MKTITSFSLGALSSAFLSVGFAQAAQLCDPNLGHQGLITSTEDIATLACDPPCWLMKS